eukprot:CAMPEP_0185705748 /NCGR_PEP_ID=MMETSP1164-20130828/20521_1 /TAXON_ID=1104430 /ORGANISM="Chrysoreinhardia sp, Strain CCMP2950" /LENGTH=216 /DNA_ID=CAMNT_0028373137 /DNA_START=146 /DNA_END=797 /DNA_ORIENTATION=-
MTRQLVARDPGPRMLTTRELASSPNVPQLTTMRSETTSGVPRSTVAIDFTPVSTAAGAPVAAAAAAAAGALWRHLAAHKVLNGPRRRDHSPPSVAAAFGGVDVSAGVQLPGVFPFVITLRAQASLLRAKLWGVHRATRARCRSLTCFRIYPQVGEPPSEPITPEQAPEPLQAIGESPITTRREARATESSGNLTKIVMDTRTELGPLEKESLNTTL